MYLFEDKFPTVALATDNIKLSITALIDQLTALRQASQQDSAKICECLILLSELHCELSLYDSAELITIEALDIARQHSPYENHIETTCLCQQAKLCKLRGESKTSNRLLFQALEILLGYLYRLSEIVRDAYCWLSEIYSQDSDKLDLNITALVKTKAKHYIAKNSRCKLTVTPQNYAIISHLDGLASKAESRILDAQDWLQMFAREDTEALNLKTDDVVRRISAQKFSKLKDAKKQAFSGKDGLLDFTSRYLSICFYGLAEILSVQGRVDKSTEAYQKAIEISETDYASVEYSFTDAVSALAFYLRFTDNSKSASLYLSAISVIEGAAQVDNERLSWLLWSLGGCYPDQVELATSIYSRALSIGIEAMPIDADLISLCLRSLSDTLLRQNQCNEAIRLYEEHITRFRTIKPNDLYGLNQRLVELARLHRKDKNLAAADTLYSEALKLEELIWPRDCRNHTGTYGELYQFYDQLNNYQKMEELQTNWLNRLRGSSNIDFDQLSSSLSSLAEFYQRQGRYLEAENCAIEAISIYKQLSVRSELSLATLHWQLATAQQKLLKLDEAIENFTSVLDMVRMCYPPDDVRIADALHTLGRVYNQKQQYKKALPLHLEALDIYRASLSPDDPEIVESLDEIAKIYSALEQ